MKPRTFIFAATASVLLGLAVLSACADTISAGYDPPSGPGPFAQPDAGAPVFDAGMCNSYECPSPYTTCPSKRGLCTTNVESDPDNCGACGNRCGFPPDAGPIVTTSADLYCIEGSCRIDCRGTLGDCNANIEDGCETSLLDDPANCGGCGLACKPGEICWQGACGCPPGFTECAGDCRRIEDDPVNCGACGTTCGLPDPDAGAAAWPCGEVGKIPPNVGPACSNSACGLGCYGGMADCNQNWCDDGCETSLLSDRKNCGVCGNECAPDQQCVAGRCMCGDPALAFCDYGCVDLLTDPANCGGCGRRCPGYAANAAEGSPRCVLGQCTYYCPPDRADCDGRIDNGCETEIMVDPRNCGGCGVHCDLEGGQPCAGGQCLTKPCPAPDAGVPF